MRRCCNRNQCQANSQKSRCVQKRPAALNVCAFGTAGSDISGHADGDSQFRAHRSDAAYITPSLLLLGWRR
jgi:hypothetical protein